MGAVNYDNPMRLPAATAALLAALAAATAARAQTGDVLIQAGHEGRPAHCLALGFGAARCGRTGAAFARPGRPTEREIAWTPVVADEATAVLRRHGLRVIRRPADYRIAQPDRVRAAVFLHFDGASPACASGASVGYPSSTSPAFVAGWKTAYRELQAPIPFMRDNFTENEHRYYGFHDVDAPEKMLVEFGELSCPAQAAWMKPRLRELGDRLAAFLLASLAR